MDLAQISSAIGSLGFPIVCCGALFWLYIKQSKQHSDEMQAIRDALNNNTLALQKLYERLEVK